MGIAATNDSPAFVRAWKTSGGGGDPFDLKNTMRKFSCSLAPNSDGPGWGVELSLVAPTASAEKEIMNHFTKNPEDNAFSFEFGWDGVSVSEEIVSTLTDIKYSLNLGGEITLKCIFTRGATGVLSQAQNKSRHQKATTTASVEAKKSGIGKGCVKLIAKVLKFPGVTTAIWGKEVAKRIDETHGAIKRQVASGKLTGAGQSQGGAPGEYGGFQWEDHNIYDDEGTEGLNSPTAGGGSMNDALAADMALDIMFEGSPFKFQSTGGNRLLDPEDPDGNLHSLWGESREAIDDPWNSAGRDYDDSPLVGHLDTGPSMNVDKNHFQMLLGEIPIPSIPAKSPAGFLPIIEGPSESMYRLMHLKNEIYNTAPLFKGFDLDGRLEFWKDGESPMVVPASQGGYTSTKLAEWSRSPEGGWVEHPVTFSFIRKNLIKTGEYGNGFSNSFFEVPKPSAFDTDSLGNGVFIYRLSSQTTGKLIAETVKFNASIERVDALFVTLEDVEEGTPDETGRVTTPFNEFIYQENPFENPLTYALDGDGEGGDGEDGGGQNGDPEKVTCTLAIEEGEDVMAWLANVLTWVNGNDVNTDSGNDLTFKFLDGHNITKGSLLKKVVKNPRKGRTYLIIAPLNMFRGEGLKSVGSFGGIGGHDLTLTVGGWDSIVEGLDVSHSVLPALQMPASKGPKKSVSKAEAESGQAAKAAKEEVGEETSPEEVKKLILGGELEGPNAENAARQSTGEGDAEATCEVDGEEEETGKKQIQPVDTNITQAKDGGKAESTKRAAKSAINWAAANFTVKVRTLGIPEISSAFETNRKVHLHVPDIRGGSGTHGLTGNYFIVDWAHQIDTDVGFKTTLTLQATENEFNG